MNAMSSPLTHISVSQQSYAWINFTSGVLQFAVLPLLTDRIDRLWILLPSIILSLAAYMTMTNHWTLPLTALSFIIMKTMEYSLRQVLTEKVGADLADVNASCTSGWSLTMCDSSSTRSHILVCALCNYNNRSLSHWTTKVATWGNKSLLSFPTALASRPLPWPWPHQHSSLASQCLCITLECVGSSCLPCGL